jgi:hypothetical protein
LRFLAAATSEQRRLSFPKTVAGAITTWFFVGRRLDPQCQLLQRQVQRQYGDVRL